MVIAIAEDKYHVPKLISAIHDNLTDYISLAVADEIGMSTFTAEYTSDQTDVDIITPSSGKRISVISGITTTDATSGVIKLDFPTSNKPIWRHYASAVKEVGAWKLNIIGAVNEPVRLNTTTGANSVFIVINYRETD